MGKLYVYVVEKKDVSYFSNLISLHDEVWGVVVGGGGTSFRFTAS